MYEVGVVVLVIVSAVFLWLLDWSRYDEGEVLVEARDPGCEPVAEG